MDKEKRNIPHYMIYFRENVIVGFKTMYNFKANFYSSIFKNFLGGLLQIFFIYILYTQFEEVIHWVFSDFLIFLFFIVLVNGFANVIYEEKELDIYIKTGMLNNFIFRPKNPFWNYFFYSETSALIYLFAHMIIFIPALFFFGNFPILGLFLSSLLSLLLIITTTFLYYFISSISFFSLNLGKVLKNQIFYETTSLLKNMPGSFFEHSKAKYLISFFPLYFVSLVLVPISKLEFTQKIYIYIFWLLFLLLILSVSTILMWHYGLKRYEAYG